MKSIFSLILLLLAATTFFYIGMPIVNGSDNSLLQEYFLTGRKEDGIGKGMGINQLKEETVRLNSGLEITRKLSQLSAELEKKVNSISPEQQQSLDRFLPDGVDNVQLVLDVNSIAAKSGMKIKGIKIDNTDQTQKTDVTVPVASSTEPKVAKLQMSFTVEGSYETFLGFLDNLSKSLRLLDVQSIKFQSSDKGENFYKYDVTVQTYWLK